MNTIKLSIPTNTHTLNAKLEVPSDNKIKQYAIFAHCFTCNSDLGVVRHISRSLTQKGIAVLRFDFTGLGQSEGTFTDTNFSGNVSDILKVNEYLAEYYQAAEILIGHSLGGTAILMAAAKLKNIKAMVTIGSPSEASHVQHLFEHQKEKIEKTGEAEVNIGGRPFNIKKQFIDDLQETNVLKVVKSLRIPYLILHSPQDKIVEISNASELYQSAFHPKSFISLDGADHLLSRKVDALYAANIIASWASRYLPKVEEKSKPSTEGEQVLAHLDLSNNFTTDIITKNFSLVADEPKDVGGDNLGPSPYEYLNAGLGACTVMTIKLYAERKKWNLKEVFVYLTYSKRDVTELNIETDSIGKIDFIEKKIRFIGDLDVTQREKLIQIAAKCPVHKTLQSKVVIETKEVN